MHRSAERKHPDVGRIPEHVEDRLRGPSGAPLGRATRVVEPPTDGRRTPPAICAEREDPPDERRLLLHRFEQPALEAQADRLAAYIPSQPGWKLVRPYSDQISGKTLDRPGLQQALSAARADRYELLLLSRSIVWRAPRSASLAFSRTLDVAGVAFRSASEPFDTETATDG
jgi:hypothetical protein